MKAGINRYNASEFWRWIILLLLTHIKYHKFCNYVFVVSRITTIKIEVIVTNISQLAISSFVDKDIIALARAGNLIKRLRAIQSRL